MKSFEDLNLLSATELYFVQETKELRTLKLSENTFEDYAAFIKVNTNYFTKQT